MKDIAEAAGSVYEIEFLDTGQVGLDVTVEDHCSRRELTSLVQKESVGKEIIAEAAVFVSDRIWNNLHAWGLEKSKIGRFKV